MGRHLRVFAATTPATNQPAPFGQIGARFVGLIEYAFVQTKMFRDWRAGLMHAGIFWGFVLLTIGTAKIVTGGIIQQVLSIPIDGLFWALISAMQKKAKGFLFLDTHAGEGLYDLNSVDSRRSAESTAQDRKLGREF